MQLHPLRIAICLGLLGLTGPAWAQTLDLGDVGERGFVILGVAVDDATGAGVSGAGDVNGDGLADLIVGAPGADGDAGVAYVVFGKTDNDPVDLNNLGTAGFAILGASAGDDIGQTVSGAGDVNGDGLADLIVGSETASTAYVVFGKADPAPVDLANLGDGGFQMDGGSGRRAGASVSGAGDMNGDGLADVIVGATRANAPLNQSGAAYVVFGKVDSSPVSLVDLGEGGFRIGGASTNTLMGNSVSGAGDINGDGLADVLVGHVASNLAAERAGEAYVVFGKRDANDVDIRDLGARGFAIRGAAANHRAGASVAGIGDLNGDGLADLVIGVTGDNVGASNNSGANYVLFGKTDFEPVDLGNLGAGGFRIGGVGGQRTGISLAGTGDLNGDGLADVIVCAGSSAPNGIASGAAFVVFGKSSASNLSLGDLGENGFGILGAAAGDRAGGSVSGAGDVNGDGLPDVIVGATGVDGTGAAYVVFSDFSLPASSSYLATSANDDAAVTRFGDPGDGSMDDSPDGRAWIDFDNGSDPGGPASIEELSLIRNVGSFNDALATVSWQFVSSRTGFSDALLTVRYLDSELESGAQEGALQLYYSPTGTAPFTQLNSIVDAPRNRISARINAGQTGFFYIGERIVFDTIFSNGFEAL